MKHILEKYKEKAVQLDSQDPLKSFKSKFALPQKADMIYLCNNSLGLPTKSAFTEMQAQLQGWSELGVEGWFKGESNWYSGFESAVKRPLSMLLETKEDEVTVMNSLTINLHLLLTSFYAPKKKQI